MMQGEDNKKRKWRGKGEAANTCGDHGTGLKSQSGDNLGKGGKTGFIDTYKGDNYVVISFWLVSSLVVPYVRAPWNLAFNEF